MALQYAGPASRALLITAIVASAFALVRMAFEREAGAFVPCPKNRLTVAHAGGGIDKRIYTNSREAIERNFKAGFRHFEIDFLELKDGTLAAFHNLEDTTEFGSRKHISEYSLSEFSSNRYFGQLTPMSANDILEFLQSHRDTFLITDLKDSLLRRQADDERPYGKRMRDIAAAFDDVARHFDSSTTERIIVQIYAFDDIRWARKLSFKPRLIWTQYRGPQYDAEQLVTLLRLLPEVDFVAVKRGHVTAEFVQQLNAAGVGVLVFTVNDEAERSRIEKIGGCGVYTDFLPPLQPMAFVTGAS